jgi:FkbM family methyltransferase
MSIKGCVVLINQVFKDMYLRIRRVEDTVILQKSFSVRNYVKHKRSMYSVMLQDLIKNPMGITSYIRYYYVSNLLKNNIMKEINGVKYEFNFNINPQYLKQTYFNIYRLDLIDIMKKKLKTGSIFLDIGANVGYISAIGASLVGKSGQVHSFEPIPECVSCLEKMKTLNPEYNIFVNSCACSDKKGFSNIDVSASDIRLNTMVPNFLGKNNVKENINVPICRLDDYVFENNLKNISFIKIDTEGFEQKVLKGLQKYFENTSSVDRPPIYCEIVPAVYPILRLSLESLNNYMERYSYYAYDCRDVSKRVDITKLEKTTNVLFLSRPYV